MFGRSPYPTVEEMVGNFRPYGGGVMARMVDPAGTATYSIANTLLTEPQ